MDGGRTSDLMRSSGSKDLKRSRRERTP
jgi:hypothetical protein